MHLNAICIVWILFIENSFYGKIKSCRTTLRMILQPGCLYVRNIVQGLSPFVQRWSCAEAILLFQWSIIFHVIHNIHIAHLVFIRLTYIGDSVTCTLHRTTCRESITIRYRNLVSHWIEHLRGQRISLTKLDPFVIWLYHVTGYYFPQGMSMRSIRKRMNSLIFHYATSRLHIHRSSRHYDAACS